MTSRCVGKRDAGKCSEEAETRQTVTVGLFKFTFSKIVLNE